MSKSCDYCGGNNGFWVMPNGDHYLNEEPEGVWTPCPVCRPDVLTPEYLKKLAEKTEGSIRQSERGA